MLCFLKISLYNNFLSFVRSVQMIYILIRCMSTAVNARAEEIKYRCVWLATRIRWLIFAGLREIVASFKQRKYNQLQAKYHIRLKK